MPITDSNSFTSAPLKMVEVPGGWLINGHFYDDKWVPLGCTGSLVSPTAALAGQSMSMDKMAVISSTRFANVPGPVHIVDNLDPEVSYSATFGSDPLEHRILKVRTNGNKKKVIGGVNSTSTPTIVTRIVGQNNVYVFVAAQDTEDNISYFRAYRKSTDSITTIKAVGGYASQHCEILVTGSNRFFFCSGGTAAAGAYTLVKIDFAAGALSSSPSVTFPAGVLNNGDPVYVPLTATTGKIVQAMTKTTTGAFAIYEIPVTISGGVPTLAAPVLCTVPSITLPGADIQVRTYAKVVDDKVRVVIVPRCQMSDLSIAGATESLGNMYVLDELTPLTYDLTQTLPLLISTATRDLIDVKDDASQLMLCTSSSVTVVEDKNGVYRITETLTGSVLSIGVSQLKDMYVMLADTSVHVISTALASRISIVPVGGNDYDISDGAPITTVLKVNAFNSSDDRLAVSLTLKIVGNATFDDNRLKTVDVLTNAASDTDVSITITNRGNITVTPVKVGSV